MEVVATWKNCGMEKLTWNDSVLVKIDTQVFMIECLEDITIRCLFTRVC